MMKESGAWLGAPTVRSLATTLNNRSGTRCSIRRDTSPSKCCDRTRSAALSRSSRVTMCQFQSSQCQEGHLHRSLEYQGSSGQPVSCWLIDLPTGGCDRFDARGPVGAVRRLLATDLGRATPGEQRRAERDEAGRIGHPTDCLVSGHSGRYGDLGDGGHEPIGDKLLNKKAQGQFCKVHVTVKNIGTRPARSTPPTSTPTTPL